MLSRLTAMVQDVAIGAASVFKSDCEMTVRDWATTGRGCVSRWKRKNAAKNKLQTRFFAFAKLSGTSLPPFPTVHATFLVWKAGSKVNIGWLWG